ncbi:NAD(P)/FAD-dependent oxidoreductase [Dehalobacter sp. DCM]|uniref:NAD(P)/FAD-dependent oxidoreductase n=1 Tax=Dehalobacter sp. DCM TaxID=2907827 RepID=UPI003081F61E|nr:NAD(P)/FAD-dependent oxidoreductase [Dehalobacter sp. DCM]
MPKKALIIGGGPAGLTAAYTLLKQTSIIPVIVEKEDFVGGISRTANHNGNRIDIGGHRFFTKSPEVLNLWHALMPVQGKPSIDDILLNNSEKILVPGGPDPETVDNVFLIRRRVSRILYLRKFFDYPISLKLQTLTNLGFINVIKAGTAYVTSQVFKREEKTLEDFMVNRFGTALYKMFFKDYTYKVWGKDPSEIAADWGAQRIKGLSLTKAVIHMLKSPFMKKDLAQNSVETSLIELYTYPKKGPGQLWEVMADQIRAMGGEIRLNTTAEKFTLANGKLVSAAVRNHESGLLENMEADFVISSMPICELVSALGPDIPAEVNAVASELPYRDFITVGLLVKSIKLKNTTKIPTVKDRVPDCWIYIQEPDVKVGRLQMFNNWSPYMVKDFESTVWLGLEYFCEEGDTMWTMSDDDFIAFAIDEAERIGILNKGDILDSVRIKVQKAYPAYFGSYSRFDLVKEHLNTYSNLYCIGRNGQHRYNNMDHSMMTAMEAVRLIQNGESMNDSLWNVNAEKDYHEEADKK